LFSFTKICIDSYISFEKFVQCRFSKLLSAKYSIVQKVQVCFTSKIDFSSSKHDPSKKTSMNSVDEGTSERVSPGRISKEYGRRLFLYLWRTCPQSHVLTVHILMIFTPHMYPGRI
jgi:hypothetical protein